MGQSDGGSKGAFPSGTDSLAEASQAQEPHWGCAIPSPSWAPDWWHSLAPAGRKMLGCLLLLSTLALVATALSSRSNAAEPRARPAERWSALAPAVLAALPAHRSPLQLQQQPLQGPSPIALTPSLGEADALPLMDSDNQARCLWNSTILPTTVVPSAYALTINVHIDEAFAEGTVDITVASAASTHCVVLGALGLTVSSVSYTTASGRTRGQVLRVSDELQQVVLFFSTPLPAGEATLQLAFRYPLAAGLNGLYLSAFTDARGVNHTLAVTKFEPVGARKAFPCFDEPRYKAVFRLTLWAPRGLVALSNTQEEEAGISPTLDSQETSAAPAMVRHRFAATPPMATYLLAFVIGDLATADQAYTACTPVAGGASIQVLVWSTPDNVGQLGLSLDVACSALTAFTDLFQVPYGLAKLDVVGIPDFAAGAMENWGLITVREADLLCDPALPDVMLIAHTAAEVAHEVAHMWFGDLVTTSDWSELWLNEGFARYWEGPGADANFMVDGVAQYQYSASFFATVTAVALLNDALPTSHPLSLASPITDLAQIPYMFDKISYEKGASVLRMLRAYLNRHNISDTTASGTTAQPLRRRGLSSTVTQHVAKTGSLPDPSTSEGGRAIELHSGVITPAGAVLPQRSRLRQALLQRRSSSLSRRGLDKGLALSGGGNDGVAGRRSMVEGASDEQAAAPGGGDPLLRGLTLYLRNNMYGSGTAPRLWDALANVTGEPIGSWMAGWTYRPHFPLVSASLMADATAPSGWSLHLSQQPITGERCDRNTAWWIPYSYAVQGSSSTTQWIEPAGSAACETQITLSGPASGSGGAGSSDAAPARAASPWVLINPARYGFYRTNYSQELWGQLTDAAADSAVVPSADMAGLLDDASQLSSLGLLSPLVFMNLTQSLGARLTSEYEPWVVALGALRQMGVLLDTAATSDDAYGQCADQLRAYIRSHMTGPMVNELQLQGAPAGVKGLNFTVFSGEPIQQRMLRPLILEQDGLAGNRRQVEDALRQLAAAQSGGPVVAGDVNGAAYELAVFSGNNSAYDDIHHMFLQSTDLNERAKLLSALTAAPTAEAIERTLTVILSPAVRLQDVARTLTKLGLRGGPAFNLTWELVLERTDELLARFSSASGAADTMGRTLLALAPLFTDAAMLPRLQRFADTYSQGVYQMVDSTFMDVVRQGVARNQAWLDTSAPLLCDWLAHNV